MPPTKSTKLAAMYGTCFLDSPILAEVFRAGHTRTHTHTQL